MEIHEILCAGSPGDRLRVNDRVNELVIVPHSETNLVACPDQECLFLKGNGTDYRIRLAADPQNEAPVLEWWSGSERITNVQRSFRNRR